MYYLFKKRIPRGKEQQYELISTHQSIVEAEKMRYKIVLPFIKKDKLKPHYNSWEEWINDEYPIREEGTFRTRYIF